MNCRKLNAGRGAINDNVVHAFSRRFVVECQLSFGRTQGRRTFSFSDALMSD
jgi:hypothetical protein